MSDDLQNERTVPCRVPPEQVGAALDDAARALGAAASAQKDGAWRIVGGTWLATNPNAALWSVRATVGPDGVRLAGEPGVFPWTRARVARIVAVRLAQIAEVIAPRLSGGTVRELAPHEIAPFAVAEGPADVCRAYAAGALSAAASLACVYAAVLIVGVQIMDGQMVELMDRAVICQRAGAAALPTITELTAMTAADRLWMAAWFAMPIAFFLGIVHVAVHWVGDAWRPMARLAPWAAVVQLVASLFAFVPALPAWSAVPCALLVPVAANVGTTLVWARRRATVITTARAADRRLWLVAAGLVVVAAALVTPALSRESLLDSVALFRDRWLLTHAPGRAFAAHYYRYTPYAAEPLKRIYVVEEKDKAEYLRSVRTALVVGDVPEATVAALKRADFVVDRGPDESAWHGHDIVVKSDTPATPEKFAELANVRYRGGGLLELSGAGWQAIYFAGGPFVLAMLAALLAVPASALYARSAQAGHATIAAAIAVAVVAFVVLRARTTDDRHAIAYREYRALRKGEKVLPTADVADPDLRVRLWAVAAAGLSRDTSRRPALLAALEDPELFVRYRAAEGLGHLGGRDRATIAALEAMMRNGTWYEGLYALSALRRIDPDRW